MQAMSHGASCCLVFLLLVEFSRFGVVNSEAITLKVGLYANTFLSNGSYDDNGAQSMAGFLMAINEINNIPSILPNVSIAVAFRSGRGTYGAITAAQSFINANFTIDNKGNPIKRSTFIRNNPIGVDVILGAGNNDETKQTNQVLNYFKIVQLHTVATSTDLGVGQDFPYKVQTTPIISYEGMVLQHILCYHFKIEKVAVFCSEDNDGLKSIVEISDGNYCNIETLLVEELAVGVRDFSSAIAAAKLSGALVFVIFMPPIATAMFLEQAYDQGLLVEGTQVFGNSLATDSSIWTYFKNKENAKIIMKGFIGVKYAPKFGIHATTVGRAFSQRYRQQANTVVTHTDGTTTCINSTDNTGEYLYRSPKHSTVGPVQCSGLNFSRFHTNGTNMFPFTPHAYDAVYALAQGIQRLLAKGSKNSITGSSLLTTLLEDIYFTGATGLVKFYGGMSGSLWYARGNREVGHTYILYNFNDVMYDATNGTDAFAIVGKWHLESGGVTPCTEDNELLFGGECEEFIYRTSDNSLPSDTPPDIFVGISAAVGASMLATGLIVLTIVFTSLAIVYKFRKSRLIKASQPSMVYIIHLGCILGGIRTIIGGLEVTDSTCIAAFWTGHLAFGLTFSALLVKTWRVHQVVNNKSLKRVKITGHTVTSMSITIVSVLVIFLTISTVVGKPHLSYITSSESNQFTRSPICSFELAEFSTALYAIEALSLMYGARLCYATKDAPDAINEAYFIASAVFIIVLICAIVFPVIFILKSTSNIINQLIASVTFSAVTVFVIVIIFYPKISVLAFGGDIDVVAGFKKKTSMLAKAELDRITTESRKRRAESRASLSSRQAGTVNGDESRGRRGDITDSTTALSAPKVLNKGTYAENASLCLSQVHKWEQLMIMIETRHATIDEPSSCSASQDGSVEEAFVSHLNNYASSSKPREAADRYA